MNQDSLFTEIVIHKGTHVCMTISDTQFNGLPGVSDGHLDSLNL